MLVADVLLPKARRAALAWVTLLALAATAAALVPFANTHVEVAHGLLAVDRFALFFKIIFLGRGGDHRADVDPLPRRSKARRRPASTTS